MPGSLVLPRVEHVNTRIGEIADITGHQFAFVRAGRCSNDRVEGRHGFTFCFGLHRHVCPDLRDILVKRQDSIFKTDLQLLQPKCQFRSPFGFGHPCHATLQFTPGHRADAKLMGFARLEPVEDLAVGRALDQLREHASV